MNKYFKKYLSWRGVTVTSLIFLFATIFKDVYIPSNKLVSVIASIIICVLITIAILVISLVVEYAFQEIGDEK